jgi:hypothetical protein
LLIICPLLNVIDIYVIEDSPYRLAFLPECDHIYLVAFLHQGLGVAPHSEIYLIKCICNDTGVHKSFRVLGIWCCPSRGSELEVRDRLVS